MCVSINLTQAMQNHLYDAKVQAASARCFARMVFTSASAGGDGPQVLLQAYNIHQGDADVQKWMALGLAGVRDESIARTDILNILCKVMKAYPKDAEVQYLASLGIGHLRFGLTPAAEALASSLPTALSEDVWHTLPLCCSSRWKALVPPLRPELVPDKCSVLQVRNTSR